MGRAAIRAIQHLRGCTAYTTPAQVDFASLEKNEIKPHLRRMWCIPPEQNAEFVCAMENVLEVYKRPYDPKHPVICMDEKPKQLVKETRTPLPCGTGRAERFDYEYERNGTANVFLFVEPLRGRRRVEVTERRTRIDWAHQIKQLLDVDCRRAEKVTLVMDNLNTHGPASLYEAFQPAEARRLREKLEIVHTPRHGSWLNVAEVELAVLEKQSIGGRVPDRASLSERTKAWERERNEAKVKVNWQFTTPNARIKLRRLYPQVQS
ncbi:MAG TPA: IS630 family transposase [Candidatus Limnocylindrales bacterium]|nr:IS630 family transposase [Candidatus Limnocylindrales bacterium]